MLPPRAQSGSREVPGSGTLCAEPVLTSALMNLYQVQRRSPSAYPLWVDASRMTNICGYRHRLSSMRSGNVTERAARSFPGCQDVRQSLFASQYFTS